MICLAGFTRKSLLSRRGQRGTKMACRRPRKNFAYFGASTDHGDDLSLTGERKTFPLRLDAEELRELKRWAEDESHSSNGQIEFILHQTLARQRGGKANSRSAPEASPSIEMNDSFAMSCFCTAAALKIPEPKRHTSETWRSRRIPMSVCLR